MQSMAKILYFTTLTVVLVLLPSALGKITCYRGIDVQMPGAHFKQSMASLGCNNANFCLRSFGTFNGKAGAFASCVAWQNETTTCGNYPACKKVTSGSGATLTDYTTCCCKTELCNNDDFTGDTNVSPSTSPSGASSTPGSDVATHSVSGLLLTAATFLTFFL